MELNSIHKHPANKHSHATEETDEEQTEERLIHRRATTIPKRLAQPPPYNSYSRCDMRSDSDSGVDMWRSLNGAGVGALRGVEVDG
jgi:hypothetical protein